MSKGLKVKELRVGVLYKHTQLTHQRIVVERGGFLNLRKIGVIRRITRLGR